MHSLDLNKMSNGEINVITHQCDLIYYDGPLLSLYKHDSKNKVILMALSSENNNERWAIFKVENNSIDEYLNDKIDLRTLCLNQENIFVAEFDSSFNIQEFKKIPIKEYKEEDLPLPELFHN